MASNATYEKEPEKFPWESEVPTSPFWNELGNLGQTVLGIIGHDGLAKLNLDEQISLPKNDRINIILKALDSYLVPSPQTLDEESYYNYRRISIAIATCYMLLKQYEEAQAIGHSLNATHFARHGSPDIGAINTFAWTSERQGNYKDAVEYAEQCLPMLKQNPMLGPDCPQVLGMMRLEMQALGKDGKVTEALALNKEGYAVIESMRAGQFAKYHGEEIEAMDELKNVLDIAQKAAGKVPMEWQPAGMQ